MKAKTEMQRIYLDYMATTPVDERVAAKMVECLDRTGVFGNPASEHFYGQAARAVVEAARGEVAALINAAPREIIWTSGATEANNLALKGAAHFYQRQGKHIVTMATEHKAVLGCCRHLETQGFTVTYLKPETNGILDLSKLEAALRPDTILVSIMHVNNEIGVIQDIAAIGAVTRAHGIILHVDAAQSAGKLPIDVKAMQADLMSFAAHKVYGPKGCGALYVRGTPRLHLEPQMHGGGQEHGLRSGTLAVHQIAGMGEAFRLARAEMCAENARILELREQLWRGISDLPGIVLNGAAARRVAHNLNVSFAGQNGELLLSQLEARGLAVSAGSACAVASVTPSHVLQAIGVSPELSQSTIRFSLGRFTTVAEIASAVAAVRGAVLRA